MERLIHRVLMPKKQSTTPTVGTKRILIVEDEKPLAHALELKMNHEGYATTVASTGALGLQEAASGKYDVILLDLILPEVDGFTILEEMKKRGAKTVVIILSNLGQDEDRKKAQEYGVRAYLVKSNIPSRISPTRITLGSCRISARNPLAKVRFVSGFT